MAMKHIPRQLELEAKLGKQQQQSSLCANTCRTTNLQSTYWSKLVYMQLDTCPVEISAATPASYNNLKGLNKTPVTIDYPLVGKLPWRGIYLPGAVLRDDMDKAGGLKHAAVVIHAVQVVAALLDVSGKRGRRLGRSSAVVGDQQPPAWLQHPQEPGHVIQLYHAHRA